MAPAGTLVFGRVHTGSVGFRTDRRENWYGAGDVYLACRPGRARTAMVRAGDHEQVVLDVEAITSVAGADQVWFTGYQPVSAGLGEGWNTTCTYVRDTVLTAPNIAAQPLLIGNAARLLAAMALTVFPNDALVDPPAEHRHDAHPAGLRRAVAFIDENAHRDVGPAEIAAAAYVTVRALQLAFRRHLGTTPTGYLRRVRLEHVRRQLLSADPATATIAEIAARWGFANHSRFTAVYRTAYGERPSQSLRHQ